ncbi:MAG: polysaccharide biosynthesis C-terminal domain-containing protein [Bacteroidales bacterium]|nr:polysaccharide biosynthesis C-terminal domain-containing protein [Bacteroidales bacterium]
MKFNIREYFKLSIIYTLVAAFPPLLQLLIMPVIEGYDRLGPIDFSQLAITEAISTLAFTFAIYAMGNAINRFYYDYMDDRKGYNRLVSSILSSILFRGLILVGIVLIFGNFIGSLFSQEGLQDFSKYGLATIIIGINRAINISVATLYRNEKKVFRFVLINVALGIIRTIAQLIALFYYDMSFVGYIYGTAIGGGVTALSLLIYLYYHCGYKYDFQLMKAVNKFARPLFQYGLVSWGILFADRFFLEASPTELGIYDTALRFALGFQMIAQGLAGAAQPEIFRMMSLGIKEKQEEIKKISNILLAQTQVLIALIIIPTMLYLTFLYETELKLASSLITIIFVRFLVRMQFIVFSNPVYYLKKTRIFFYINTFALIVNLGLNFLLIPIWQIYGAVAASIVALFIQVILIYYYQNKLVKISWNINKVFVYPFVIVGITIILEILKVIFNINPYITAVLVILTIFVSLSILYRKEIKRKVLKL